MSESPGNFTAPEKSAGANFVVRRYMPGDGAALSEAVNSSYEHLKTFMPWAVPNQAVEVSEKLVRDFSGRWLCGTDFVIGIWTPDNKRLLGGCGYHLREGPIELRNAEIGMWIRADSAKKGLGRAVLKQLLLWGFSDWPWLRLSWRCSGANLASQRVAEAAGMKREGVLRSNAVDPDGTRRDTVCYAALRAEWKNPDHK
jgi:RimJ/RimL family protein N-acetyltransferase